MRKPAIAGGVFFANSWLELRDDFRYNSCAHSLAAFADSKTHLLFHGDRCDELDLKNSLVLSRVSYSQDRLSLHVIPSLTPHAIPIKVCVYTPQLAARLAGVLNYIWWYDTRDADDPPYRRGEL